MKFLALAATAAALSLRSQVQSMLKDPESVAGYFLSTSNDNIMKDLDLNKDGQITWPEVEEKIKSLDHPDVGVARDLFLTMGQGRESITKRDLEKFQDGIGTILKVAGCGKQ